MNLEEISVKSIDDILRCVNLSSLLELSGWPKPGNVHRTRDFMNTRFEHFLGGIVAIQPNFKEFCEQIFNKFENEKEAFNDINLGLFIKKAVNEMMRWQHGGNVLLGHILVLTPLIAAAVICLRMNNKTLKGFKDNLKRVIQGTTVQDTINLYEAIKICNPGGLGKIDKYDITNENSIEELKADEITLRDIFEVSKDYDLISSEYSTGFVIILNEGLKYYFESYNQFKDINIATVNTFLKLLSEHPDTLIIRKSGLESALSVSKMALKILKKGGISTKKGLKMCYKFDKNIQKKKGKLNPGTTADLVAGVIFTTLLFGLRY
ncbi:MAG: triphosphoribosyl-dephospho-CoA synthase [Candidatus Heimdallarchaeota archaeon]